MRLLDPTDLQQALAALPHWAHDPARPALKRRFVFADFPQAFAFMTEMAIVSEKQDHHPEWFNVHRVVEVTLTTHDAGGISARDIAWARAADAAFDRRAPSTPAAGARS